MNTINEKLSKLKFKEIEKAIDASIQVRSSLENKVVAYLIPTGDWILNRTKVLSDIAKWRNKYMRFYFTQFEANIENATSYILSKSNLNSSSIFFMIADTDFKIIGHLGFSNIFGDSAELDNILLGERTDTPNLMIDIENQSINWIREYLGIKRIILQVFSFNFLAINLHQECGFKTLEITPLRKVDYLSKTKYELCGKSESDLTFTCVTMGKNLEVD